MKSGVDQKRLLDYIEKNHKDYLKKEGKAEDLL